MCVWLAASLLALENGKFLTFDCVNDNKWQVLHKSMRNNKKQKSGFVEESNYYSERVGGTSAPHVAMTRRATLLKPRMPPFNAET